MTVKIERTEIRSFSLSVIEADMASKADNKHLYVENLPDNPVPLHSNRGAAIGGGLIGYLTGKALNRAKLGTAAGIVGGTAMSIGHNAGLRQHNQKFFSHPYAVEKVLPKSGLSTHMNIQDKYGVDSMRLRFDADKAKEQNG